jgi:hypothetical protein
VVLGHVAGTLKRGGSVMVLDRVQRNALYQFVVTDLVGVGDIALALQAGNVPQARRLRQRFEEDLLLLDLLGWRCDEGKDRYELDVSAGMRVALVRLRTNAREVIEDAAEEFRQDTLDEALDVVEACSVLLRPNEGS